MLVRPANLRTPTRVANDILTLSYNPLIIKEPVDISIPHFDLWPPCRLTIMKQHWMRGIWYALFTWCDGLNWIYQINLSQLEFGNHDWSWYINHQKSPDRSGVYLQCHEMYMYIGAQLQHTRCTCSMGCFMIFGQPHQMSFQLNLVTFDDLCHDVVNLIRRG